MFVQMFRGKRGIEAGWRLILIVVLTLAAFIVLYMIVGDAIKEVLRLN